MTQRHLTAQHQATRTEARREQQIQEMQQERLIRLLKEETDRQVPRENREKANQPINT